MIGVGSKLDKESALARILIVDFSGHQLHDTFCLPKISVMVTVPIYAEYTLSGCKLLEH